MKLTQLFLCSAALALPLTLHAATEKKNDRWFEVEVILFSQLGDKSQLTENFPDSSELPKYRRSTDLLNAYINPKIGSLKQLLPSCDAPIYPEHAVQRNANLPAIFQEKSLAALSQLVDEELALLNNFTKADNSRFGDQTVSDGATLNDTVQTNLESRSSETSNVNININDQKNAITANESDLSSTIDTVETQVELTDEELAKIQGLVNAAEEEFQQLKFQYNLAPEPTLLCRIDEHYFSDYQASNPSFNYNGFTVDKMPLLIDALEEPYNEKTHLLSKASLQLNDVITDLRYSKNFRPLLHMGWRQVARPKKQSVPVKVYAGDNFAADHEKKLSDFNSQKNQKMAQLLAYANKQQSTTVSSVSVQVDKNQAEQQQAEQLQQAKKARIEQIINQLSQVNEDSDPLFTSLDGQNNILTLDNDESLTAAAPLPPVQDWLLEGFFNIHLKHYLFITADFNILDKNLSELATAQLSGTTAINTETDNVLGTKVNIDGTTPIQPKAIRFKQNRRVISGEVHYFDHPYIGMVVQIRPYSMPAREESN
ncbi:hypothetical protein EKO29_14615 [Colwellia sp. Arc7-635]|uniref:CsiV family protein n=1 Tax=Colwellia sp. Arc7-635 TaxID=2497879 RepID=UPI000F8582F0|nr:CsiV family protein [Colwellia sp. Arc7-635]AZQ85105.1 hypothetical protein EKO29_14615 [Colwellia sp. Arc7-635]